MFNIIFDLKTHVHESIEDFTTTLPFLPFLGMNIFLDQEHVSFPEPMDPGNWFSVVSVDYQLKDDIFLIELKELNEFGSSVQ